MNANQAVKSILEREQASTIETSLAMGKSKTYLSTFISTKAEPKAGTLTSFCEAINYELVLRSKEDGFEFIIDE